MRSLSTWRVRATAVIVGLVGLLLHSAPAAALNCSATVAAPVLGSVNLLAGGNYDAFGTLYVSCAGSASETNINVVVCPSINAGTGNGASNGPQRYLKSGSSQVAFNLYKDAYTTVWGSNSMSGASPARLVVPLGADGTGSANIALYARIIGGQPTLPPGVYTSDFLVDVRSTTNTALNCAAIVTNPASPVSFSVVATYDANCLMQTSNLNFGTIGRLTANIDAETLLAVTCSYGNAYTVGLSGGTGNVSDPTARLLKKSGSPDVIYGLYKDAARGQPWGTTIGMSNGGTGSGLAQTLTVFGRIPIQPFPEIGLYQDTIVVTVTY
jgi:spore coat protein U-like protein